LRIFVIFWECTQWEHGNYAYINIEGVGLQIIEVSNPSAPKLSGSYNNKTVLKILIDNGYAYIGSTDGLLILRLTNQATSVPK